MMIKNAKSDWTDKEYSQFAEWAKSCLKDGDCIVEFVKKDGTLRTMKCTLDPKKIPQTELTETKKERTITNTDNVPVYDLEANGWRSFNIRSVQAFTFGVLE